MTQNETGNWHSFLQRLKGLASDYQRQGLVIVSVRLIMGHGRLSGWSIPSVQPIEPGSGGGQLLDYLTDEEKIP